MDNHVIATHPNFLWMQSGIHMPAIDTSILIYGAFVGMLLLANVIYLSRTKGRH